MNRDLSHDWHFGREELIQVKVSEAQWANFVSTPNTGMGVPCTIEHVNNERMPDIPLRTTHDVANREARELAVRAAAGIQKTVDAIAGELGAGLSQKKKDAILEHLHRARRDLDDSMPFLIKSFDKHTETTVERAKIEVAAYMDAAVHRAGLAALGASLQQPLSIGVGDNTDAGEDAP